ncbi:MAG: hypothetical protein JRF35_12625, partial [Deltaproteobacteria bacterium]|nr:hypothetical protein [Deltaproteobacteria bacterium]
AKETLKLLEEGVRKETIDTAKARVAEGRAALGQAKANMKKIEAAEQEVATAQAGVRAAQSALKLARTHLEYTQLRAPFAGVITSRNVELAPGVYTIEGALCRGDNESQR